MSSRNIRIACQFFHFFFLLDFHFQLINSVDPFDDFLDSSQLEHIFTEHNEAVMPSLEHLKPHWLESIDLNQSISVNIQSHFNIRLHNSFVQFALQEYCISAKMFTSNFSAERWAHVVCVSLCVFVCVQCANHNDKSLSAVSCSRYCFLGFIWNEKKTTDNNRTPSEHNLFAMHSLHSCLCCSLTNGKTVPKLHSSSSTSHRLSRNICE